MIVAVRRDCCFHRWVKRLIPQEQCELPRRRCVAFPMLGVVRIGIRRGCFGIPGRVWSGCIFVMAGKTVRDLVYEDTLMQYSR